MSSLENLLNQAITPTSQHYSSETVKMIVKLVNTEPNGTGTALRLIAHKLQSPIEREALNALALLEVLIKHCEPALISELGKFKFLNEVIKVISPKYLGDQTTQEVRRKCIHLLHQWQKDFGKTEPKFVEAYHMLCKQGLINPEEVSVRENGTAPKVVDSARIPNIFDRSKHSEKLTKLLRSRNATDIAEANRIIKNILEEDERHLEKVTQRSAELEALKNNALLLSEMTCTLVRGEASEAELELMNELANNIRKARSLLYNSSLTQEENDVGALSEIVHICERAGAALDNYEQGVRCSKTQVQSGLGTPISTKPSPDDLLSKDLLELGVDVDRFPLPNSKSVTPSTELFKTLIITPSTPNIAPSKYDDLDIIFSSLSTSSSTLGPILPAAIPAHSTTAPLSTPSQSSLQSKFQFAKQPTSPSSATKMFDDLDTLGRQLFGLTSSHVPPSSVKDDSLVSLIPLDDVSTTRTEQSEPSDLVTLSVPSTESATTAVNLSDLCVPLPSIVPHPTLHEPFVIYPREPCAEKTVQLSFHYAGNRPAPNVRVLVAVVTNRSPSPIKDIHLRFGVNKPLVLRQLSLSGHDLSPFSPFLPVDVVNQVVLIFDPSQQSTINLKFQLSFVLNDEAILESGEAELPVA